MNCPGERSFARKLPLLAALLALAVLVAGCGDSSGASASGNACAPAAKPGSKMVALTAPTQKLDRSRTYLAEFQTNCGNFVIKLDAKNNPKTAGSFAFLVQKGLYNNTWFHRIIDGFVIQGGDPRANGQGDAGYSVVEKPTGKYQIGTVAMAKTGSEPAGTSSSQFYIVTGAQGTQLPKDYAIAGKVLSGQATLKKIAAFAAPPTDQTGAPTGVALVRRAIIKIQP